MAALDFPASPVDGQTYSNWVYSSSKGAWQAKPLTPGQAQPSATAPTSPSNGDQWYNTNDGNLYIYYNDGDTSQWVQVKSDVSFTSTFGTRLTTLETYPSGLVPIVPTNVNVSSGSATISSSGKVSVTTASTIARLNGVFSSSFDNYRIVVSKFTTSTIGTNVFSRLNVSGTDNTVAVYSVNGSYQAGTGSPTLWNQTTDWFNLCQSAGDTFISMDLSNPYVANRTKGTFQAAGYTAANAAWNVGILHDSSTQFTGISFFPGAGTFTGEIQVFGYRQ